MALQQMKQDTSAKGLAIRLEHEIMEVSGMLVAWSLLAAVEGTIRVVSFANPSVGFTPDDTNIFPPLALLIGGVGESVFGVLGLLVGIGCLMMKYRNPGPLLYFLIIQGILGWYVFIVNVVTQPLHAGHEMLMAGRFGLSLETDRFLIWMGVITSIVWCAALQSGQFILAFRLKQLMEGTPETLEKHTIRALCWTIFAAIAGLSMLISGGIVLEDVTGDSPFLPPLLPAYPPHVMIYPELVVSAGLFTLCWGILGAVGAAMKNTQILGMFHVSWFFIFLSNLIAFAQIFGRVQDGALAAPAAQHVVLIFAFTTLPVIFTRKMVEALESPFKGDAEKKETV